LPEALPLTGPMLHLTESFLPSLFTSVPVVTSTSTSRSIDSCADSSAAQPRGWSRSGTGRHRRSRRRRRGSRSDRSWW
jgi:hypothetical protein